jgi:hypothetical protein
MEVTGFKVRLTSTEGRYDPAEMADRRHIIDSIKELTNTGFTSNPVTCREGMT